MAESCRVDPTSFVSSPSLEKYLQSMGFDDMTDTRLRYVRRVLGQLAGIVLASLLPLLVIAQGDGKVDFDIPPQSLRSALMQVAQNQKIHIFFNEDEVRALSTKGLKGRFSTKEAIERLLEGTRLAASFDGRSAVAIRAKGEGRRSGVSGGAPISGPTLLAQTPSQGASATTTHRGEKIEVTGSRVTRLDGIGPSPVITISREEIERSGAATVREVLNQLPQNAVSFDEGGATFAGVSFAQLRGLKRGATLVLLNGKRLSPSGIVQDIFDLNNIPLAAVERIEVLLDTASAIYGADALGGAINFILRRGYEGAAIGGRFGTSYKSDATERQGSLVVGKAFDRLSAMVALEAFHRDGITHDARSLTADKDYRRFGGPDLRSTSSFPANVYSLPGAGNLPGLSSRSAGAPLGTSGASLRPGDFLAGALHRFEEAPYRTLIPESRRSGVLGVLEYQFEYGPSAYLEALYSKNHQALISPPAALTGGSAGSFRVPASNPFNPFGVAVGVDYRFLELGAQQLDLDAQFWRVVAGAKGTFARRFEWDLSLSADRESGEVSRRGGINQAAARAALADTSAATALNVFSSLGNNNPGTLAAIRSDTLDTGETEALSAEAVLRGPLFRLPSGEIQFAVGASARREEAELIQTVGGFPRQERDVQAVFGEVVIPLLASTGGLRYTPLELTLAGRYDRYSDFGSTTNPQAGLLWRPLSNFVARISGGTAFKPPTLRQGAQGRTESQVVVTDPLRGNESVTVQFFAGGAPPGVLEPETAKSVTVGFSWEPTQISGLSLGADVYRIHLDKNIQGLAAAVLLVNPDLFPDRIARAAPTPQDVAAGRPGRLLSVDVSTTNYGYVESRGIDVNATWKGPASKVGRFIAALNATYVDRFDVALTPGAAPIGSVSRAAGPGNPVRFRAAGSLNWTSPSSALSATVSGRYLGRYIDFDGTRQLGDDFWFDIQGRYSFATHYPEPLRKLSVTVGVINVANKQGDFSNNALGYDFQRADMRGRFFYLAAQKEF